MTVIDGGPATSLAWIHTERGRPDQCDGNHVAATAPRQLCMSRVSDSSAPDRPPQLDVQVSSCASLVNAFPAPGLLTMTGDLTASTVDALVRGALVEYVRFARHAVIDATSLASIDDCGAALLDELVNVTRGVAGTLWVHNPGALVEHVIRFCGVSDRLQICTSP